MLYVGALALCALGTGSPAAAQSGGEKVLRFAAQADMKTRDPYVTTTGITYLHAAAILDVLFAWDRNLQPQPQMAEGYTLSDDRLTYLITLRDGLAFHDGTRVEASNVVASIKRLLVTDNFGRLLAPDVALVGETDDGAIEIVLSKPNAQTLFRISGANKNTGIMRKEDVPEDPSTPVRLTEEEQIAHVDAPGFGLEKWVSKDMSASRFGQLTNCTKSDRVGNGR